MGIVEPVAQHVVATEPLHWPAAEVLDGVLHLVLALGQVAVHHDVQLLRQIHRGPNDLLGLILGDAGADAHLAHRESGGVVVFLDQTLGVGHDALGGVHHLGGNNVVGHRVVGPHRVEADTQFPGGLNLRVHQAGDPHRVGIPQVVGGGHAGFQAVAKTGIDTGPRHISVEILVNLVHGGEPRLQPQTLGSLDVADQRLPGVVVGIDKAGENHAPAGIHHFVDVYRAGQALFQIRADGLDLIPLDEQVTVAIAGTRLVHGDDPICVLIQSTFHICVFPPIRWLRLAY